MRAPRPLLAALGGLLMLGVGVGIALWLRPVRVDRSLRTYEAPRASGPITLDGRLDEPAWESAPVAGPFVRSDGRALAPLDATARLLWDDDALYVGFHVVDRDLISPHTARDEPIYTRDVVEVFLDPGGDGLNYYEFQVSPRGVLFDALFPSHRKNLKRSQAWNAPGLRAGVTLNGDLDAPGGDSGYTVELRIPWYAITHAPRSPPAPGDAWRMNLFRIDVHAEGGDFTAWTPPLVGDFHALDRFGTLVFKGD